MDSWGNGENSGFISAAFSQIVQKRSRRAAVTSGEASNFL
jgi:hypothetical protein